MRVAVSALALFLCIFAVFIFLVIFKTASVYTQFFYVPIILFSFWWLRKGIILTSTIVVVLLLCNIIFSPNISVVDNLIRSAMFLFVSALTSIIFEHRKRLLHEIKENEQRWASTLTSIGDAVIAADTFGNITFMNNEAEKLTGWTLVNAKQKPVKQVFRIINEQTHLELDDPVAKVLETGQVVGLTNHTVLICKDETEVTIDDSAAPIKNEEGKLTGVVLVFRDITERRLAEKVQKRLLHDVGERVKELNCLYGLASLVETPSISLDEILQGATDLICAAYQYPDITCSRIIFEDKQFQTDNFKETPWKQYVNIKLNGEKIGVIDVYYLEEKPIFDDGPFLTQEMHLLDSVAERLGRVIERRKVHDELIYLKDFSASVIESINESLMVIDPANYKIMATNSETCRELKINAEDLVGMTCYEATHHSLTPCVAPHVCPLRAVLNTGEPARVEHVHLDKDQNKTYVEINLYPFKDNKGRIIRVIHITRNITERKKMECALLESEAKLRSTLEASPEGITLMDMDGKVVDCNQAILDLFDYSNKLEIIGKAGFDSRTIQATAKEKMLNDLMELRNKGELNNVQWYLVTRKGREFVAEVSAKTIKDASGNPKNIVTVIRDITDRIKAEKKLLESEEKYQTTFESSMDALMLLDEKGFFDCNLATLKLFRCKTVTEFTENHPADLSPFTQPEGTPSMQAANDHVVRAFKEGSDHFFWIHKRTDETTFPADVLLNRIVINGRTVLQATVRDITQQKEAEEALKQAEEKHRILLNSANVLVQSVDAEGKYLFVNEEWKKVLGYTDFDLKEINMSNVVRKDHLPYCMGVFKQVMDGLSIHDVETVFVAKDGKEIVVSGNACPIFKDGMFVSTVAFFEDITERKKTEAKLRESTHRIALMNEKLRVVGSLTRHDVRNKLSAITGYSYILKKKHPDQADVVDGLDKMVEAVNSSMKIFDFAKAYEQIGVEELVDC